MLNLVTVVGRLVDSPKVEEINNKKKVYITLACNRSYKNADGVYETDFIDCVLWDGITTNVCEYCQKGDIIGIRGRIQTEVIDEEDETKRKVTEIIAEKVTFLSNRKSNNEEE